MSGGVELLLVAGTKIPKWIKIQSKNVTVRRKTVNGVNVRSLKIRRAKAAFFPGGSVGIIMPGSNEFWIAFNPFTILEIRDLRGNVIKSNYYLCRECFFLTGRIESTKPSSIGRGLVDAVNKCTQCGSQWELQRI